MRNNKSKKNKRCSATQRIDFPAKMTTGHATMIRDLLKENGTKYKHPDKTTMHTRTSHALLERADWQSQGSRLTKPCGDNDMMGGRQ